MSTTNEPDLEDLVFLEEDDEFIPEYHEEDNSQETVSESTEDISDNSSNEDSKIENINSTEPDVDIDTTSEEIEDSSIDTEESEYTEDVDENDTSYVDQFNYLKTLGLVSVADDFEFDGTAEGLEQIIEYTKQNTLKAGASAIWEQLPNDFKVVLEYALAGGTDINKVNALLQKDVDYDSLDLEDEQHQEIIIREFLKQTTKFNDKKIDRYIQKAKMAGSLEEESESALQEIKEYKDQQKQQLLEEEKTAQIERQQRLVESYNTFTDTVSKIANIDNRRRQQIVQSLWTTGKFGDYDSISRFNYVDMLIRNNPEHLAQLAQLYLDYDPKDGIVNSKLMKKVESTQKAKLKDVFDSLGRASTPSKLKTNKTPIKKKSSQNIAMNQLEQWLEQNS